MKTMLKRLASEDRGDVPGWVLITLMTAGLPVGTRWGSSCTAHICCVPAHCPANGPLTLQWSSVADLRGPLESRRHAQAANPAVLPKSADRRGRFCGGEGRRV